MRVDYIDRMSRGESIVRIGHIWYGADEKTTVTSVAFAPATNIKTVRGLRTESALAFSQNRPVEKTIITTIVVSYDAFRTHVQELDAMTRVTPVVPVQGVLFSALIDPLSSRQRGGDETNVTRLLALAEHYVAIDSIELSTINEAPRDVQVTLVMTKVATPFLEDERERYIKTLDGAYQQASLVDSLNRTRGDSPATDAIARMIGVDVTQYQRMIYAMQNRGQRLPLENAKLVVHLANGSVAFIGEFRAFEHDQAINGPIAYIIPLGVDVALPFRAREGATKILGTVRRGTLCCVIIGTSPVCDDRGVYLAEAYVITDTTGKLRSSTRILTPEMVATFADGQSVFLKE